VSLEPETAFWIEVERRRYRDKNRNGEKGRCPTPLEGRAEACPVNTAGRLQCPAFWPTKHAARPEQSVDLPNDWIDLKVLFSCKDTLHKHVLSKRGLQTFKEERKGCVPHDVRKRAQNRLCWSYASAFSLSATWKLAWYSARLLYFAATGRYRF
jgi:hypothetical protein